MIDHIKKSEKAYDKKAERYNKTIDSKVTEYLKKMIIEEISFNC